MRCMKPEGHFSQHFTSLMLMLVEVQVNSNVTEGNFASKRWYEKQMCECVSSVLMLMLMEVQINSNVTERNCATKCCNIRKVREYVSNILT